jgi:hypothetical protein
MDNGDVIVKQGHVEYVEDTADGLRIKIRIPQDGNEPLENLPYAFPLLPKTFQSVPKVGEGALVFTQLSGNKLSQRYYIGPIISQPQFQEKCNYNYGRGNATSLFKGGELKPLGKISNEKKTWGAFPNTEDVAVVGRGSQDIIMRNNYETSSNEIDIRCGIRENPKAATKDIIGKVIFNTVDPAYIQLKYKNSLTNGNLQKSNSMINLVADKINIISNQDVHQFELTDIDELIREDKLDSIMSNLHRVAHGDTLVELLKLIIKSLLTHVHACNGDPAKVAGYTKEMAGYTVDKILSEHVRIS